MSRLEEADSGDCSQDIIASWATGEVKRTEEEEETRDGLRGAEVGRLLGSSWIADLPHTEVDSGSQCSASIGSWEGEAKVQPFGEKSEIAEHVCDDEEGTEREVDGIGRSRSRKKALKGGLEEQLERALEWGRWGRAETLYNSLPL